METTRSAASCGAAGHAGALLPEQQQAVPRAARRSPAAGRRARCPRPPRPARVRRGEVEQLGDRVVVVQLQVAVGHHGAAAVPAAAAHDVHAGRAERVRGAHHGADVVVVPEVLDGHVEGVRPGGEIGGHRVPPPVAVGVDHVAGVAVLEQLRVVARVGRPGRPAARPRSHADLARHRPLAGAGRVRRPGVLACRDDRRAGAGTGRRLDRRRLRRLVPRDAGSTRGSPVGCAARSIEAAAPVAPAGASS